MYPNGGFPVPYDTLNGSSHSGNYGPGQSNNHPVPGRPQMSNLPQGSPNQMVQAPYLGISNGIDMYNHAQPTGYPANNEWLQLPTNAYSYPSAPVTYAQWPYQNQMRPEAVMQAHQRQQSAPSPTTPTLPGNNSLQGSPTVSSTAHGHPQVLHANLKPSSVKQKGNTLAPQNAQRSQIQHRNGDYPSKPCSNSHKRSNSGAMLPPSKRPCHSNLLRSPVTAQEKVGPAFARQIKNWGSISPAQATINRGQSTVGSVQKKTEKARSGHLCRDNIMLAPPGTVIATSPKEAQSKAGAIQGHVDKFKARFPELRNQVDNASSNQKTYSKAKYNQRMMSSIDQQCLAEIEAARHPNQTIQMPPFPRVESDNIEQEVQAAGEKARRLDTLINLHTEPKALMQEAIEYKNIMDETNSDQWPGRALNPYEKYGPQATFVPFPILPERTENLKDKIKLYNRLLSVVEGKMMQLTRPQCGEESILDGIVTPVPKLFKDPQPSLENCVKCRRIIAPYLRCLETALQRFEARPKPPVPEQQKEEKRIAEEKFQADFKLFVDQDKVVSARQGVKAAGQV